jgi:hypothetical protein
MAIASMTVNRTCKQTLKVIFCRRYTSEGEVVFMVAALGVVMDTTTLNQRFYGGGETEYTSKQHEMHSKSEAEMVPFHRDDIICMDISHDRKKVVTGEVGKFPAVHVWDVATCTNLDSF